MGQTIPTPEPLPTCAACLFPIQFYDDLERVSGTNVCLACYNRAARRPDECEPSPLVWSQVQRILASH